MASSVSSGSRIPESREWGDPGYIFSRYGGIDRVRRLSRSSVVWGSVASTVACVSTENDMLSVRDAFSVICRNPSGVSSVRTVVHLTFGTRGRGSDSPYVRQTNYLSALYRLVDTGRFLVFDSSIDAEGDTASVLCVYSGGGSYVRTSGRRPSGRRSSKAPRSRKTTTNAKERHQHA